MLQQQKSRCFIEARRVTRHRCAGRAHPDCCIQLCQEVSRQAGLTLAAQVLQEAQRNLCCFIILTFHVVVPHYMEPHEHAGDAQHVCRQAR